eukprot:2923724-Prymnesium_polylepis.1
MDTFYKLTGVPWGSRKQLLGRAEVRADVQWGLGTAKEATRHGYTLEQRFLLNGREVGETE